MLSNMAAFSFMYGITEEERILFQMHIKESG
jgi:hypothetical protein